MKYHPKPYNKTEDKKSYITKIVEEEKNKIEKLKKTNNNNKDEESSVE